MKKVILGTVALSLVVSSVALAAPLAKLEQGKGKIDASLSLGASLKDEAHGEKIDLGGKTRYRAGATYGLGNNLGLDYVYASNAGDRDSSVQSHQINLMYQLNNYITAFGGYVYNKAEVGGWNNNTNGYQVGLQGRMDLAPRTVGWAKFGIGNTITQYELGVGYDLTHNWEANLFYNDSKYKDFDDDTNMKTHNVNLGVSYKF